MTRYVAEGWWDDTTLGQLVAKNAAAHAENTLRVYSEVRPWSGTFGELDQCARALAGSLRAAGVAPGSVVLMQLPNWAEAVVTFWATMYLGAVTVPVVRFYGARELEYIVQATRPDVVVSPDKFGRTDYLAIYEPVLGRRPSAHWLVVGDTAAASLPAGAVPFREMLGSEFVDGPASVSPDDVAAVVFTSGTTSKPKGVIHSHRTILAELRQSATVTLPDVAPPALAGAPIGHMTGLLDVMFRPLVRSRPVRLIDRWDPGKVLHLMRDEGVTAAGGPTYFLTSLLDHPDFRAEDAKLIPFCHMGGSPVPEAVAERATSLGITVKRGYGSTELPSVTACTFMDPAAKRLRTDGRPLGGVEIRLDEEGVIHARGPELCLGYTDPALTAEMFDGEGWYRTADIGVLDADGYLTIKDRASDLIIRGGENISAQEVEEALATLNGITEVAVVAEPDDRLGEHAAAVFTIRHDAQPPVLEQVRAHLGAAGLAPQKWPESLYHVREFPRTPSGKILKFRLRQQLRAGGLDNLA